ncbi:MAG TPA: NADH-quinone oxidoreductase subunit L, partial [Bryobacteraceae bacterium]|nr:NADH-quinone oxidoreductase subunit L [Bryobacteraceae bacterium]
AVTAAGAFLFGLYLAYFFFHRRRDYAAAIAAAPLGRALHNWWFAGWGFDWLYGRVFVRPVEGMARVNRKDVFDPIYNGMAALAALCWKLLSGTQTGLLRRYAAGIAAGVIVLVAIALFL